MVPELKNLDYADRLKKLKVPTLASQKSCGDMRKTFKIVKNIDNPDWNMFTKREGGIIVVSPNKPYVIMKCLKV